MCVWRRTRRHVSVAPFYEEPIDQLAERIGIDQVLFGSDYPHAEGLADPVSFVDDLPDFSKDEVMGRDLVAEFITDDYKESVRGVLQDALIGHWGNVFFGVSLLITFPFAFTGG